MTDVVVKRDLRIPMSDGVDLLADHYHSRSADPQPLLLVRSPYGRRGLAGFQYGQLFAERGFQVVIQSTRGAYGSGGQLEPMVCEAADGQATVEWLRHQPWFPGTFAVMGASYMGFAGWALAVDPPPELKAMALHIVPHRWNSVAYPGGAYALETTLAWASDMVGPELSDSVIMNLVDLFRPARAREDRLRQAFRTLPLQDAAQQLMERDVPFFRRWLDYGPLDSYWDAYDASSALAKVDVPVFLLSGWQDIFRDQTIEQYHQLRERGVAVELTVGPWTHFGLAESWPLLVKESVDFLQRQLVGTPSLRRPPARVYVGGADEWTSVDAWPPPTAPRRLFLQDGAALGQSPSTDSRQSHFRYNPADPTPAVGGPTLAHDAGSRDNRGLESRDDVLTFTTSELDTDLEIAGAPEVALHVASSARETDFFVRLCDVDDVGRSHNITDGIVRLKEGDWQGQSEGPQRVLLPLSPVAHRFRRGHRLRLQISSGAHPRFARNGGSGEPLAKTTTLVAADQAIYHDAERPSSLTLPIVTP